MNNITPEFIKLASHPEIQTMHPTGRYVISVGGTAWLRDALTPEDYKNDVGENYKMPDLGWLVRKLRLYGRFFIEGSDFPSKDCDWQAQLWHIDDEDNSIFTFGDTPELACLKALCKIKGIEVTA